MVKKSGKERKGLERQIKKYADNPTMIRKLKGRLNGLKEDRRR